MTVHWTDIAKQHLQNIYDHIEPQSELYAQRLVNKLRVDGLGDFPEMGRAVPEYEDPNVRELLVSPYRITYVLQKTDNWCNSRSSKSLARLLKWR
ncbi:MAG: type II toxin-antitoxin system RelE/ParE family toxin [Deinococcales bacterium]